MNVVETGVMSQETVFSESAAMRDLVREALAAAASRVDLTVAGERGTGRRLIARLIHACGPNAGGPLITVECDGGTDAGEALFGVCGAEDLRVRGTVPRLAPTCAALAASGGTLLLADLDELPARLQAGLARLLKDRHAITMDGSTVLLSARVVATVGPGFDLAMNEGRLRCDLSRLLNTIRLEVPPLRQRREDIPALARYLLSEAATRLALPPKTLTRAAQSVIAALPWKGNVPELRALLERTFASAPRRIVDVDDLVAQMPINRADSVAAAGRTLKDARISFERNYITAVLQRHQWRVPQAARALGLARPNLYRKMRALGIRPTA